MDSRPAGGRLVDSGLAGGRLMGSRLVDGRVIGGQLLGSRAIGDRLVSDRLVGDRLVRDRVGGRLIGGRSLGGVARTRGGSRSEPPARTTDRRGVGGTGGRRRVVRAGQILGGDPRVCGTFCRLCHNIRQSATTCASSQAFPESRRGDRPEAPRPAYTPGPESGRSARRGHAYGRQPRSDNVCWTITGAGPRRLGHPSCPRPNSCPTSWLIR